MGRFPFCHANGIFQQFYLEKDPRGTAFSSMFNFLASKFLFPGDQVAVFPRPGRQTGSEELRDRHHGRGSVSGREASADDPGSRGAPTARRFANIFVQPVTPPPSSVIIVLPKFPQSKAEEERVVFALTLLQSGKHHRDAWQDFRLSLLGCGFCAVPSDNFTSAEIGIFAIGITRLVDEDFLASISGDAGAERGVQREGLDYLTAPDFQALDSMFEAVTAGICQRRFRIPSGFFRSKGFFLHSRTEKRKF